MSKLAWVLVLVAVMVFGLDGTSAWARDGKSGKQKGGKRVSAKAMFARMDANSDGAVSKDEYAAARERRATKSGKALTPAASAKRFAKIDKNRDGTLTLKELASSLRTAKQHHGAKGGKRGGGRAKVRA